MSEKLDKLEKTIGYTFKNKDLLTQALTHSSYSNERRINKVMCYERIEFLGDAVLEILVSEYLYKENPDKNEGELTKIRASLVCEHTLSMCSRDIKLGDYVLLSRGEACTGGSERDSILCDLFESLLGAIYLDGGMDAAKAHVYKFLLNDVDDKTLFYDAKTSLQEIIQSNQGEVVHYEIIDSTGPEHCKEYVASVSIGDKCLGTGKGKNKKSAEQMAAYEALRILKNKK